MGAIITIDGATKTIVISDSGDVTVTAKEIYSRWKDWVLAGNTQWVEAFRTFGGDPLGGGIFAGDYYFLNNVAGWRIKPEEKNHKLTINGNLYGEDPDADIFIPTVGNFNVVIKQGYSSLTQTATFSTGSGLDPTQNQKLNELHRIHGLESGVPLVVNKTSRTAGTIDQSITQSGDEVTVTRI
jgi:hypothetical protein